MDDFGTLAARLQRDNALLDITIGNRYPAVLAQVFGPGFGDEMLDETRWSDLYELGVSPAEAARRARAEGWLGD